MLVYPLLHSHRESTTLAFAGQAVQVFPTKTVFDGHWHWLLAPTGQNLHVPLTFWKLGWHSQRPFTKLEFVGQVPHWPFIRFPFPGHWQTPATAYCPPVQGVQVPEIFTWFCMHTH